MTPPKPDPPPHQPATSLPSSDEAFRGFLLRIEQLIAALVVLMLLVGILLILWDVGMGVWQGFSNDSGDFGLTNLLSQALLALMIAEIISSVGALFEGGVLDPIPLLIIGIIASIRRLLVISAEAANFLAEHTEVPSNMLIELAILTVAIGIFAWSIRQVRPSRSVTRLVDEETRAGHGNASAASPSHDQAQENQQP